MLIALGAGIFKPVVIATIGRTTDDSNRGLGFGIFYMMVNIGGFFRSITGTYHSKKLRLAVRFYLCFPLDFAEFYPSIIFL